MTQEAIKMQRVATSLAMFFKPVRVVMHKYGIMGIFQLTNCG